MMGGWDRALDALVDLQHSYKTPEGRRYLAGFTDELGRKMEPHVVGDGHNEAALITTQTVLHLDRTEPVWVSADVLDLVEAAAFRARRDGKPRPFEPEPIYLDDLFTESAFCLLERPIEVRHEDGTGVKIRAIQWHPAQFGPQNEPAHEGVTIAVYSDFRDVDGHRPAAHIGGSALSLTWVQGVIYGWDPPTHAFPRNLFAQLQVMWRLAQQEIVTAGHERASRPAWRRASNWRQIKRVRVLTLRRVRPRRYEGEGRDVHWTHRFLVRGHWRNQPYKINGETVSRQIWIAEYVKGDESLPLVIKDRAVEFVR